MTAKIKKECGKATLPESRIMEKYRKKMEEHIMQNLAPQKYG
jgi:hypothetical protein